MVALPNGLAVFAVGMPDLGAVPVPALTTFDFAGEKMYSAVPVPAFDSTLHLHLHKLEGFRLDDGLVIILDIILRDFVLVNLRLFGQVVGGVGLLQQGITLVFFIAEYAFYGRNAPLLFTARCGDAVIGELLGNAVIGHSLQEHSVDAFNDYRLFPVDDQIAVRPTVVAKEPRERYGNLTVCKAFSLAPGAVLRNAAAFHNSGSSSGLDVFYMSRSLCAGQFIPAAEGRDLILRKTKGISDSSVAVAGLTQGGDLLLLFVCHSDLQSEEVPHYPLEVNRLF